MTVVMNSIYDDLNLSAQKQVKSEMLDKSHFYDFRQNIYNGQMPQKFKEMFLSGDGGELAAKACAVHSSSMLGYNFFHWVEDFPITIEWKKGGPVCYNQVFFEEKMPVLVGTTPANMDIVLRNSNGDVLFIESKFLEYVNGKQNEFKLGKSYFKPQKYYTKGEDWIDLISSLDTTKKSQYWEGIEQEIKHLIAITNWLEGKTEVGGVWYNGVSNVRFINLVFEPKESYSEHISFVEYRDRYDELHASLESHKLIPKCLGMEYMTYSDIWPFIERVLPKPLKEYLETRYMVFAK